MVSNDVVPVRSARPGYQQCQFGRVDRFVRSDDIIPTDKMTSLINKQHGGSLRHHQTCMISLMNSVHSPIIRGRISPLEVLQILHLVVLVDILPVCLPADWVVEATLCTHADRPRRASCLQQNQAHQRMSAYMT
jgi:hypothetical protein